MIEITKYVDGFKSELRRSLLVLAVLGILKTSEYGYNMIDCLGDSGIEIEPDTLYPLLRRLESQGLIKGNWNTDFTKPRKYYTRTLLGNQIYKEYYSCWRSAVQSINLLEGENDNEKRFD